MPVKISISRSAVEAKIQAAWKQGLGKLSTEILNDCNQYCKEDTGMLIASSLEHSKPEEGKLIWQTPYARIQYWKIRTAYKDVNPNASWKWCDVAKRHHLKRWERQAQMILKENL